MTPLSVVDKAIEQRTILVVRRGRETLVPISEIAPLVVMHRAGIPLPTAVKRRIRRWLASDRRRHAPSELALSDTIVVRFTSDVETLVDSATGYAKARDTYLEVDPEVKDGEPVIRGTRLTARAVQARLTGGDTIDDLVADYPYVEPVAFEAAATYARTHPRRGRPARPKRA